MKNSFLVYILLLILNLIMISCEKNDTVAANYLRLNDTICIKEEILYANFEHNISLRLDSVPNDSRCLPWQNCIWMGNAAVAFTFKKAKSSHSFILNTFPTYRTDTLIEGYNIKLIGLNWPEIGELRPKKYIASILIKN